MRVSGAVLDISAGWVNCVRVFMARERRNLELGFIEEGELDLPNEVVDVGRSRGEGLDAGAADGARASIALATRLRFAAGSVARSAACFATRATSRPTKLQ